MSTRKELKEEYKHRKVTMGIFQLRNTVNDRVLIDQSLDIPAKWNRIRMELKFGSHRNRLLQQDWNAQEENDFEFSVISQLEVKEDQEVNLNKELKVLFDMVVDDQGVDVGMRY